ncbi:PST family polysaccharide transporter [Nonlabens xylanidelens]|uniref:PST family polysaccharide transporter n=1 Tax=Nonlabens xylanidelens TaxID=191564 RepID=A0A2S6IFP0_9FLAO|nr:O-antigen translocase [Nonlabens xylanidelens]PPK93029.1 PST family polysaccharide transporter [Nonlabens xylanidelens]PQJ18764.1 LPS biosynthesis protein WzxE [Nonlabens xylanidelens]
MRRLLDKLNKNLLLKVAGFNSIYILIKIGTGTVMSWVLANYVGAAGMGVLGNLRNFTQGIWSFASLGLENGLVKNTAEHKENPVVLKKVINTGWTMSIVTSMVAAIVIFFSARWLDQELIAVDADFSLVFKLFAIGLPFYVLFIFITSLMQGYEWYKKFITLNIIISLIVFLISAYLSFEHNLTGALYAIALVPFTQCLVGVLFWFTRVKAQIALKELLALNFDKRTSGQLLKYSAMALFSTLLIPFVNILVRNTVRVEVSDVAAGWWEAVVRISGYYMLFVTSLVSLYVLPNLSKDSSLKNYRITIVHFYKTMLPIVIAGLVTIYLSRNLILSILFTEEFNGAQPLFKWQLLGDFIRVITTVIAFRFVAINDLWRYLTAEVLSILSFYLLSIYFIPIYQEEGVVIAYLGNYLFYLVVLLVLLRKELFSKIKVV